MIYTTANTSYILNFKILHLIIGLVEFLHINILFFYIVLMFSLSPYQRTNDQPIQTLCVIDAIKRMSSLDLIPFNIMEIYLINMLKALYGITFTYYMHNKLMKSLCKWLASTWIKFISRYFIKFICVCSMYVGRVHPHKWSIFMDRYQAKFYNVSSHGMFATSYDDLSSCCIKSKRYTWHVCVCICTLGWFLF